MAKTNSIFDKKNLTGVTLSPASVVGVSEDQVFTIDETVFRNRVKNLIDFESTSFPTDKTTWIVHALNVPSRIQGGPTCGLVSLKMCNDFLTRISGVLKLVF